MSHIDTITRAPEGFRVVASTPDTPAAAFESTERGLYGVQFHPEVVHTQMGQDLLKHFLYDACGARPTWTMSSVIETQVAAIRAQVGEGRRSEEHTSELQSLMRISYAVFCLKTKKKHTIYNPRQT